MLEADYEGEVEVIVVDDGSTDETQTVSEEFPCRLIRQAHCRGPAAARNTGARVARNELLLFVDSDTELLPNTITEGVNQLDEPGVAAVCGVYEREPVNHGFFPRYYAYLKSYAFKTSPADRLSAFGAQCAVISK